MILFGISAAAVYAVGHLLFVRLFGELVSLFVSRVSTVQCSEYDFIKQISNSTLDNEKFHKDVNAKVIQLIGMYTFKIIRFPYCNIQLLVSFKLCSAMFNIFLVNYLQLDWPIA